MQHPIHWLYQQGVGTIPAGSASCYLCGHACSLQHTVARGLADTFNSHYLAQSPSSPYLCAACQWYFDSKAGHPDFRKMSLIVKRDSWQQWQRDTMKTDIERWLTVGIEGDTYLVCSLSKKKHILLQAPMNANSSSNLIVQTEEQVAHIDQTTWQVMNHSFMRLLELGHNKGEILSGQLYGNTLRKHGQIKKALSQSQMLEPYRKSAALEFLSYVTIVEREETIDAITDEHDIRPSAPTPGHSSRPLMVRMDGDRRGIQEQVPHGHLEPVRDDGSRVQSHDDESGQVSQSTLW